jgi:vancomycin resistance protein YoaR
MEEPTEVTERPRHARRFGVGERDAERRVEREPEPRRRTSRRWPWFAAGVPVLALVVLVAAYAIDASSGGVARNVRLAGVDVGGLAEDALPVRIAELAEQFASVPVEIDTGEAVYATTAGELGLEVDQRSTAEATLAVDDDTFLLARPFAWLGSFFQERSAKLQLRASESRLATAVVDLEGEDRTLPVEPSVELVDEGFRLVPGEDGRGLDPAAVASVLPREVSSATEPIRVSVERSPIPPLGSDADAGAAIAEAERLTGESLRLVTPGGSGTVEPEVLRHWVRLGSEEDGTVRVELDPERVTADLEGAVTDIEGAPVDAGFVVEGGQVRIVPHRDGLVCCAPSSDERIIDALQAGEREVGLELRTAPPRRTTADAEALGIVEEIGSPDAFGPTTRHACCEGRVQNIHRIADIVRGVVIEPGETFSVNGYVGRRTRERGFVEAGVIYQGVFQTDVGGGVSQFATTLFNAALFAGLDFEAYQSHSIYISRYPRGHEATISFPQPDLVIRNSTPHGVLIWPEYTGTSITVRMFSTRHAEVSIGQPTSSSAGRCTRWTTPRTRTYPDGSVERDSVFALYRPGEGINC